LCTGLGERLTHAAARREKFNASINFDKRMYAQDLEGSRCYAAAICKAGIITPEECMQLVDGLHKVRAPGASAVDHCCMRGIMP
jgi:argininosuccinate lyase